MFNRSYLVTYSSYQTTKTMISKGIVWKISFTQFSTYELVCKLKFASFVNLVVTQVTYNFRI